MTSGGQLFRQRSEEKNIFFRTVKKFPQIIENTREIIENISDIFQNISEIIFATYICADFQVPDG